MGLLAGGDVLALLTFAAIGRFSHGFPVFDFETLRTADPFIAGTVLHCYLFPKFRIKKIHFYVDGKWKCG